MREEQQPETNKEMFLRSALVIPGVAVKKMKMAIDRDIEQGGDALGLVAVLGVSEVKRYKVTRKCLRGMAFGDCVNFAAETWQTLGNHVSNSTGLVAVMVPTTSPILLSTASGQLLWGPFTVL